MTRYRTPSLVLLACLIAAGASCSTSDDGGGFPFAAPPDAGASPDADPVPDADLDDSADPGDAVSEGSQLGNADQSSAGSTTAQYMTISVMRNGVGYSLITNGWGPGWQSHEISWLGTSFTVVSTEGSAGSNGQPASYPAVFCGKYSEDALGCGLPAPIDAMASLRTGWMWDPNGNDGEYNAAYDIWVGDGSGLQGYLMVWLRDPPRNRPAGSADAANQGVTVENVPGTWNIWRGSVNGLPIINWVATTEVHAIEFDVMDFLRDAEARGLDYPGTHVNAVAVGFEIWEGPITNLESLDFYTEVELQ